MTRPEDLNQVAETDPRAPRPKAQPSVADIARRILAENNHAEAPTQIVAVPDPAPDTLVAEPAVDPGVPRWPLAPKARAAGVWGFLGPLLVGIAGLVVQNAPALGPVLAAAPLWVQLGSLALVGGLSALYGAYRAPHQPRPGDGPTAA